jgi:hypothetical protein
MGVSKTLQSQHLFTAVECANRLFCRVKRYAARYFWQNSRICLLVIRAFDRVARSANRRA